MTVPLCKFKTLFTLLKYYGNNLVFCFFFKAHKEECGRFQLGVQLFMQ